MPGSRLQVLAEGNTPFLSVSNNGTSVPVAVAGDGVQMLLKMAFQLATGVGGLVLLEEPEVHKHPGAIAEASRSIIAAMRAGTQIVLTTHSLELIDSLLDLADESQDYQKIAVFRLKRKNGELLHQRVAGDQLLHIRQDVEEDLR